MPRRRDDYMYKGEEGKKSKCIFFVLFGILGFILIYFPIFAPNLRYQAGTLLSKIFSVLGTIFVMFGVLMVMAGIIMILCRRGGAGIMLMVIGVLLIFLGGYFVVPSIIGTGGSGKEVPKGYH